MLKDDLIFYRNPSEGMKDAPQWKPSTSDGSCYLHIDRHLKLVDGKLGSERLSFLAGVLGNPVIIQSL